MPLQRNIARVFDRKRVFGLAVLTCLSIAVVALATGWWFGRSWIDQAREDAPRRGPVETSVGLAAPPALRGSVEWPELLEATALPAGYTVKSSRGEESSPAPSPGAVAPRTPTRKPTSEPATDLERLRNRRLTVPVEGVGRNELWDSFLDPRGFRTHKAIDIMAPRGRPVLATEDGVIAKVFENRRGGKSIYQYGPERRYTYYYAHLDRFADGLKAGDKVRRGQVIGYVGSTGNASDDAPHLHFAIYRMGPKGRWWRGEAINPYLVLTTPG